MTGDAVLLFVQLLSVACSWRAKLQNGACGATSGRYIGYRGKEGCDVTEAANGKVHAEMNSPAGEFHLG
jgi:hypothetical protein